MPNIMAMTKQESIGERISRNDETIKHDNTSVKHQILITCLRVTRYYMSPPPSLREASLFYHFIKTTF